MRILLLPSAFAPAVGGVEELTGRLARRFQAGGDEVEVWTIRHPPTLASRESIEGVDVRRFELPLPRLSAGPLLRLPRDVRAAKRSLLRAAAEFRPDVVHVQCFSANGVYAVWLARRLSVPLVISLQGETVMDDSDIYERSATLRLALRLGLRRAEVVTACSQYVLDDALRFGLVPGRGTVVPNGVDLEYRGAPAAIDLPFDRFVFAVGRFVEKKGFDLLLQAFERLAPDHPGLGLVIGGDGPAKAPLARAASSSLAGDRVVLTGTLSHAQVTWAMDAAAAFVLPSRTEPFGIVVLEALRAGCPVVVSSRGGATEIVRDGIDGLVADPFDVAGLAAAIAQLLDDDLLATRLATSGRARVQGFDWGSIALRYRSLYAPAPAAATPARSRAPR